MNSDWKRVTLEEITQLKVSNVDKKIYTDKKLVKLCNYMDVYKNRYITNKIPYSIGSASASQINTFGLEKGDIIITKDSETPEDIGVASVVTENIENLVCGYHLAILKPNTVELSSDFLMHLLHLPKVQRQFYRVASGSTRYGLTKGAIESLKLELPKEKSTQTKIAKILTTIDKVIEKTETAVAKYEAIKQGIMHDLFTRGIGADGQLRPSYADAPELYKESALGRIPKEWDDLKLSDISKINQGLQIAISNRYKRPGVNRYLYITIQYLNNPEDENYTFYIETPQESVVCREEDILMVRTGNTGMTVTDIIGVFHNNFFKVKYDKQTDRDFLVYHLRRKEIQNLIMNYAGTTTIPDLKHGDFYKLPFPKPIKEEQKLISKRIKAIDKKIDAEKSVLSKQTQLKQGLMQDLLTGKVPVKLNKRPYEINTNSI